MSRTSTARASSSTHAWHPDGRELLVVPNVNRSGKLQHVHQPSSSSRSHTVPNVNRSGKLQHVITRTVTLGPWGTSRTSTARASSSTSIDYSIVIPRSYHTDREHPTQMDVSSTFRRGPLPVFLRRFPRLSCASVFTLLGGMSPLASGPIRQPTVDSRRRACPPRSPARTSRRSGIRPDQRRSVRRSPPGVGCRRFPGALPRFAHGRAPTARSIASTRVPSSELGIRGPRKHPTRWGAWRLGVRRAEVRLGRPVGG